MKFIEEKIKALQSTEEFHNKRIYELEQKVGAIERNFKTPIPDEQEIKRAFDVIFFKLHIAKAVLDPGKGNSTPSLNIQLEGDLKRLNDFVRYLLKMNEK